MGCSTTLLTNKDGSDIGEFLYSPFGEMWVEEASTVDISNITRFFTNQQYDRESGLYYYNARYYDPHLGSFITPDPAMQHFNHYAYSSANPIKYTDPTGLTDEPTNTITSKDEEQKKAEEEKKKEEESNKIEKEPKRYSVIIYYVNPKTDKNKSFEKAAKTKAKETPEDDILIPVRSKSDFKNAWQDLVEKLSKNGDTISSLNLFVHGGLSGLYFDEKDKSGKLDSLDDTVLTRIEIKQLSQLPFEKDAEINLHSCFGGYGNYSPAKAFADSQGVKCTGRIGYTSFSSNRNVYRMITSFSKNYYLEAFDMKKNTIGEKPTFNVIPSITFYPNNIF